MWARPLLRFVLIDGHGSLHISFQQDFSNPVTRLAMHDYPVDGGKVITQVFNGGKLLLEAPVEIRTPAARVQGKIYFINEVLQLSNGRYFIPERFFREESNEVGANKERSDSEQKMFALGNMVDLTAVLYSFAKLQETLLMIQ